jgi:hypothetical protein
MERFAFDHKPNASNKKRRKKPIGTKSDRRVSKLQGRSEFVRHCIAVDSGNRMSHWLTGKKESK